MIALKVSDKIAGSDLYSIVDRLDGVMAKHDKTHVFVEAYGIDGLQLSGLPSYFARAMPVFAKLTHFGRVAVSFPASIGAVGKHVAQPGKGVANGFQVPRRPITILHIGRMHNGANQQADRVDDNVPLAALQHLLCRIAEWATGFRRLTD